MHEKEVSDWLVLWQLDLEETDEQARPIMHLKDLSPFNVSKGKLYE